MDQTLHANFRKKQREEGRQCLGRGLYANQFHFHCVQKNQTVHDGQLLVMIVDLIRQYILGEVDTLLVRLRHLIESSETNELRGDTDRKPLQRSGVVVKDNAKALLIDRERGQVLQDHLKQGHLLAAMTMLITRSQEKPHLLVVVA
jgi:hypothetical protein